ncbi:MAG: nucleotidyltransferase domain-containing protein [Desulfobacterota bacterium]|nr:nucleotidyltransferase domain-containing protein [Thermodesulfobacteriota bacterium]
MAQNKSSIEEKFVKKISSLFSDHIVSVTFFGSRARGVPKPGSDYDFVIVLKEKDRKIIDGIYEIVTDFLIRYGVDISLKIYKEEQFLRMASYPTPFLASILKTGKELWTQKQKT